MENCIFSGTVNDGDNAGGIAGQSANSQITGRYTNGTVKAKNAGGIIGKNNRGSISDCYSSAMVESNTAWQAGGIAVLQGVPVKGFTGRR